jgi:hypothetical protein
LSDSQLDRELESALAVDPSPEFLARVRTRVADEPRMELWRLAIRGWTFEPLAGVAVIGIVLAVVIPKLMRDDATRKPAGITAAGDVSRPVVREAPAAGGAKPAVAPSPTRQVGNRAAATNELPLRLSQPLFSEEERRVFEQYFAAVEQGRVPPRPADTQVNDSSGVGQVLRIEPMAIDPLPQLSARVQTEGEAKW